MAARRRSWWGWGYEDEALGDDEIRTLGRTAGERFGTRVRACSRSPPSTVSSSGHLASSLPAALAAWCSTSTADRAGHTYGKSYRDVVRAVHGDLTDPPDVVAFPPTEADVVAVLDWCGVGGRRGDPLRRRLVGRRRRRVRRRRRLRRRRVDRPRPRSTGCSRSTARQPRRPHPGRRARARARGPAAPARAHAAPLPADRSSSRRSAAGSPPAPAATTPACTRTSTTSSSRCASSRRPGISESRRLPGSRRRPVARPPVPRLGGQRSASSPRRGCGCRTGPAGGRRPACAFARFADGVAAARRRRPVGAVPDQLPPARRRRGGDHRRRRRRRDGGALLVLGFESADHPVGAVARPRPSSCAATTAATVPGRRGRRRPTTRGSGARRRARRRRRVVALGVPAGAVPARRARPLRRDRRDVRDGVHVGRLRRRCTPA